MAETRFVTIPEDITVKVDGAKEDVVFSFGAFIHSRTVDGSFGKDLDGILLAMAIRQAFAQGVAGSVRGLKLEEWQRLCESVRSPSSPYNPSVMIQLMPFASAILDAPSTDPRAVARSVEELSKADA